MKLYALTIAGLFIVVGAWAEGGHSHGQGGHTHSHGGHSHAQEAAIDESQAKVRAGEELARLMEKKKLDASWAKAEFASAEQKETKGKKEWLVTYKSNATEKKSLYIFLSLSGKFVAANHTGN